MKGGGWKKEVAIGNLGNLVLNYVSRQTAGSPTDEKVKWTSLRPIDIAKYLKEEHQFKVSYAGYVHRTIKETILTDLEQVKRYNGENLY